MDLLQRSRYLPKRRLKTLEAGEQVFIEDFAGKKLGIATVSPNSLICARLINRDVKHPLR
jgi:23S rRNA (cytosine1962-C5)-methyltransferase